LPPNDSSESILNKILFNKSNNEIIERFQCENKFFSRECLKIEEKPIGRGNSCKVYKGKLMEKEDNSWKEIALKSFKTESNFVKYLKLIFIIIIFINIFFNPSEMD